MDFDKTAVTRVEAPLEIALAHKKFSLEEVEWMT